jgi:hypothetical protein
MWCVFACVFVRVCVCLWARVCVCLCARACVVCGVCVRACAYELTHFCPIFSADINESLQRLILQKFALVGAELTYSNGRTDTHEGANIVRP